MKEFSDSFWLQLEDSIKKLDTHLSVSAAPFEVSSFYDDNTSKMRRLMTMTIWMVMVMTMLMLHLLISFSL